MTITLKITRLLRSSKFIPVSEFGKEHPGATIGKQLMVALLYTNFKTGHRKLPIQDKQEVVAWVDLVVRVRWTMMV